MKPITEIFDHIVNPLSIPDPVIFFIPVFIISFTVEGIFLVKAWKRKYDMKEAISSIGMGLGASALNIFLKTFYFSLFLIIYNSFHFFDSLAPQGDTFFDLDWHLSHWWVWVILFLADDFTFYWCHRFGHEVRFFWAGHVNHHSSQEYNLATALRQGWLEYMVKYFFWCWLPLLGFHPIMVYIMIQINLIYQFFLHTETVKKLGFLEYFMNTPSHHRVHHGSDLKYLDRNYAGTLIVWDKLFGTFQKEEFTPTYGLTANIHTHNIFKIAFHEIIALSTDMMKAPKWKDKLKYFFYAPGWTHNGEDKRAKVLQKKKN